MRVMKPQFRKAGLLAAFAILFYPTIAICQSDPLSSAYLPSTDTNCSHSQYASNIWMTNWDAKVRQDSGTPASNACYLTIYGTQNEFVDFQVHFHDTGSGTPNLSVTVSSFVQTSPASYAISNATTRNTNTQSVNVLVYREAYMNVNYNPTSTAPLYYGTTGYFPDALIPAIDPYWGQTTNAWPFNVPAGDNQSAWVDVLLPPHAPSGYYTGSVTVKSGSTVLATMPVVIAVWQWPSAGYMPSTTTLKTEDTGFEYGAMCTEMYNGSTVGNDGGCGANYPDSGGSDDTSIRT